MCYSPGGEKRVGRGTVAETLPSLFPEAGGSILLLEDEKEVHRMTSHSVEDTGVVKLCDLSKGP